MLDAVQFGMPGHYYSALAEGAVTATLEVHLGIVTELQTIVIIQLPAGKLTIAHGMSPSIETDLALAVANSLDMRVEIEANCCLTHGC